MLLLVPLGATCLSYTTVTYLQFSQLAGGKTTDVYKGYTVTAIYSLSLFNVDKYEMGKGRKMEVRLEIWKEMVQRRCELQVHFPSPAGSFQLQRDFIGWGTGLVILLSFQSTTP